MTTPTSADVVIVGSGIAACQIARKLANAGIDVLMLEAGPRIQRWEIVESYRNSAFKGDLQSPYKPTEHAPHPQYSPEDNGYFIQKGPTPYKAGYLRVAGGTTWHWSAQAWRLLPNDFRMKTKYGVGRDWAISYDQLEPFYCEAEQELGVSGPAEDLGSPRSKPYPLPPLKMSYLDQRFKDVVAPAGYEAVLEPAGRNSVAFEDRPACCGNSNCMPICPIEAQYDGGTALRRAEAAGAKLIVNAVVYRIEHDDANRIVAVHYYNPDKTSVRVTGKHFVLAANAIETPKLMLISKSEKNPNGIGNSSDQVGRNLMDHPGTSVRFLANEPLWPGRGPMRLSCINNLRDGDFRNERSSMKINVGNYSPVRPVAEYLVGKGLVGEELNEQIRDVASRWMMVNSFFDILPNPNNRIRASDTETDALGIPKPEVHYFVDEYVDKAAVVCREHFAKIAELFGGTDVTYFDTYFNNNHIMGTLIMGNDPKDSVVDADLRSHDHPNLFIASSGVMASAGNVNCTLTLVALAVRLGDKLLAEVRA